MYPQPPDLLHDELDHWITMSLSRISLNKQNLSKSPLFKNLLLDESDMGVNIDIELQLSCNHRYTLDVALRFYFILKGSSKKLVKLADCAISVTLLLPVDDLKKK